MKQLSLFFLLLAMQQLQAQRVKFNVQPVVVTVHIKNPLQRTIVVDTRPVSPGSRSFKPQQISVRLNENNTGTVDIPLKGPAIIKIMNVWPDSTMEYLVLPGTGFTLDLDTEKKDLVSYDVTWKNENDFFESMLDDATKRLNDLPQEDPLVFFVQWQQANNDIRTMMSDTGEGRVRAAYRSWVLQNIQSLAYGILCRQFINYVTINAKWPANTDQYFAHCETFGNSQLNDPGFFNSTTDEEFITQYALFAAARKYYQQDKNHAPSIETLYSAALANANAIKAPATKKIISQFLVTSVAKISNDIKFLQQLRSSLGAESSSVYYNSIIDDRISSLKTSPVGRPAVVFDAQDSKGEAFSFAKYAGKYVYIDLWATWCVPCQLQFPFLETLKKKYEGKPIVFISMSVDKSKTPWLKFLENHTSDPDQYISAAGKPGGIMNIYQVKYIPRFMLIDKAGNMLNTNTYLPSDPAVNMLLNKILN